MYLPPRLAQPGRLRFRWVSADNDDVEMNSHPAMSPVCGWVVPNHLDNSLMLFTAGGQALGSLGVFGSQTRVTWQSAGGSAAPGIDVDLATANRHLKRIAEFIHGKDDGFFDDLMNSIEAAHTYILPGDKQAPQFQAVLMGRPLAVVRAALRLEVAGLPCFDTSSTTLEQTLSSDSGKIYDWAERSSAGLLNVDFPVRLGDRNHLEDGLVAYVIDGRQPAYDDPCPPRQECQRPLCPAAAVHASFTAPILAYSPPPASSPPCSGPKESEPSSGPSFHGQKQRPRRLSPRQV
jgi:hypothetical protein